MYRCTLQLPDSSLLCFVDRLSHTSHHSFVCCNFFAAVAAVCGVHLFHFAFVCVARSPEL